MKIDLHSHTVYSDGRLTPQQLVDRALEFNLGVLAITDHDTLAGLVEAKRYLESKQTDLTLINGIEFSTKWESFEIHIVGLNVAIETPELTALINEQQSKREVRAERMAEKLEKKGFSDVLTAAKALAGVGQLTRAHFAQVIVDQGGAKNIQAVFKKYLRRGNPGYVTSDWCDMATAISSIRAAGGKAVLAHPSRYDLSNKWLRKLLIEFKLAGGQGIEVALCQQAPCDRQFLAQLSREYQLECSQGSDFHFPTNWLELGRNLYLPKDCVPVWHDWGWQL